MKKQLALIIISMLAVMPAGAKTTNNSICTDTATNNITFSCCKKNVLESNCSHDGCPDFNWTFINSECGNVFYPDCFYDSICKPQLPQKPEFPQFPDFPVIPEEPSLPQQPSIPQKPEDGNSNENPIISDSQISTLLNLVNNERNKNGIASLTYDETLELCAYVRSKEIKSLFSHARPDGTSCFTVLDQYNYKYSTAGENIAYGQQTAQEVFRDWMNSQGHRENILSPSFTRIGLSRYENGTVYWAQMFASK